MRIVTVGGGPAGLYFSLLMKRADPSHEVTVIEADDNGLRLIERGAEASTEVR